MDTLRTSFALLVALSIGLVAWVACDSTGTASSDPPRAAEGRFTLRLTDAPTDVDSVIVTVDRVELVADDADEDDMDDDNGNDDEDDGEDDNGDRDEDGIITLTDSTRQIDLLQLQDGVTTTLADVPVPAGTYSQLRFVLGSENYVVVNGTRQTLQVPSGMTSGIKIILPEVEVENDGDQISVTLDFDVDESLIRAGASGRYLFKPTVKVKSVRVNGEAVETVDVDGVVSSVDAGAQIVRVDSIPFAVSPQTEFDDDGVSGLAGLQSGQFVEVEGTIRDDGTLVAREIEVDEEDDVERSITAPVDAIGEGSITVLGVAIKVTQNTEFEDVLGLGDLQDGDRVEVEYIFVDGSRVATDIERESD